MILNTSCLDGDGYLRSETFWIVNNPGHGFVNRHININKEKTGEPLKALIDHLIKQGFLPVKEFLRDTKQGAIILYKFDLDTNKNVLFNFYSLNSPYEDPAVDIWYNAKNELSQEIETLLSTIRKQKGESKKEKINFVFKRNTGFALSEHKVKKTVVVPDSYNLSVDEQTVIELIGNNASGLLIFSGEPGTGKSYFLRNISTQLDRKFVYVPKDVALQLSDPAFMPFALEELKDSILFIEDAEEVLRKRNEYEKTAVSTILNITDGLLGDLLNLKIVATVNVIENVDPALLRKGRLLSKVQFNKLPREQALKVANHLNKQLSTNQTEYTLAEIYNEKPNMNEEKKKIGFQI